MSKTTYALTIETPFGEFTRKATKAYTHAVVRTSPRAMKEYNERGTSKWRASGVTARWIKDRGFAVTWHGSFQAARNAAAKPYLWDAKECGVGQVFVVDQELARQRAVGVQAAAQMGG